MNSNNPIKILFLASDPSNASRLRLQQECRDIEERLQLAKQRERFELKPRLSARVRDITQAIFDIEPQIVHFSGHGTSVGDLCFENELGKIHPVDPSALAAMFKLFAKQVNCVVLNACYSEAQAKAIAEHIPFVIGMQQAIGDQAAIAFAVGFYRALGADRSIEEAYEFGCVEIQLQNIPEHLTPVLYKKKSDSSSYSNQELLTSAPLTKTDVKPENPTDAPNSRLGADTVQPSTLKRQTKISLCIHTLSAHLNTVRSIAFSPNGQVLASGSTDKTIKIWDSETGELLRTFPEQSGWVNSITISPDGQILASSSFAGEIKLWQLSTGELLDTLTGYSGAVTSVTFSPDGQILASGSDDKIIRIWNVNTKELLYTLAGHSGALNSITFSPDGQILASGSDDKKIKIWNSHTGTLLRTIVAHSGAVNCVVFSPDGQILASGSSDRTIKIWNPKTGEPLYPLTTEHLDVVHSLAFSPNGLILVSGHNDKKIKIWSLRSGQVLRSLEEHSGWISSVAISPDGQNLASGSADRTIKIWCISSIPDFGKKPPTVTTPIKPTRIKPIIHSESSADSLDSEQAIKPDESRFQEALKIANEAFIAKQRTQLKGEQVAVLRAAWYRKNYDEIAYETKYPAEHLRRNVSSKFWAILSDALGEKVNKKTFRPVLEQRLQKKALRTRRTTQQLSMGRSQTSSLSSAAQKNSDEKLSASESSASEPQAPTWKCIHTLTKHTGGVNSVASSWDRPTLASGSDDTKIKVWNLRTGEEIRTLGGLFSRPHSKSVHSIAISPNGQILASGSEDTTIKVWNLQTGRLLHTLSEHLKPVYSVAISPDGQILASGSGDTTIRIWNLQTGKKLNSIIRHSRAVKSVAFSPNGQILVSGSEDSTIKIWNPHTENLLRDLPEQSWSVDTVTISSDGQILTSGSGDNTIRVFNLHTGELLRTLKGHSVAISPDGQTIASSLDKRIMVWNLHSGELLGELRGHSGSIRSLSFSADGQTLISGSYDKTIKIWQRG